MGEVVEGYALVMRTIVNFLFTLDFGDGITVGAFFLGSTVIAIMIRFFFRSLHAGPNVAHTAMRKEMYMKREAEKAARSGKNGK